MNTYSKFSIWTSLVLLVIGILMVAYSDQAPQWLVQAIGVFLFLPGVLIVSSLLRRKKLSTSEAILTPIAGIATMILGGILFAWPTHFQLVFMYVMASTIILLGIVQGIERIVMYRKDIITSQISLLIPILSLIGGVFVLIYYREITSLPFILIGSCCIVIGCLELVSAFQWKKYAKQLQATAVETAAPATATDTAPHSETETSPETVAENDTTASEVAPQNDSSSDAPSDQPQV